MARQFTVRGRIQVDDKATPTVQKVESRMGKFSSFLSAKFAIGAAGAALAIKKLVSGIGAIVGAASRQEDAVRKLNDVLRSMGREAELDSQALQKFAADLERTTVFGDEAIINVQALLASFGGLSSEIFNRTTKAVLDLSKFLGLDLKQSAVQLGKAIGDPITGLNALRRSGISFTKEQQNTIRTLVETNRTLDAQKLILGELERQVSGQAGIKTFSDQIAALRNAFGTLIEKVGDAIIKNDEINRGLAKLREVMVSGKLIERVESLAAGFSSFFASAVKVGQALAPLARHLADVATIGWNLARTAQNLTVLLGKSLWQALVDLKDALGPIGRLFDLIGSAIGKLRGWVVESTDSLKDYTSELAFGEEQLKKTTTATEGLTEEQKKLAAEQAAAKKKEAELTAQTKALEATFEELGVTTETKTKTALEKLEDQEEQLRAAFEAERITLKDLTAGLEAIQTKREELTEAEKQATEATTAQTTAMSGLKNTQDQVKVTNDALVSSFQRVSSEANNVTQAVTMTWQAFDRLVDAQGRAAAVEAALAAGGQLEMGGRRIRLPGGGSRLVSEPGGLFSKRNNFNADGSLRRY